MDSVDFHGGKTDDFHGENGSFNFDGKRPGTCCFDGKKSRSLREMIVLQPETAVNMSTFQDVLMEHVIAQQEMDDSNMMIPSRKSLGWKTRWFLVNVKGQPVLV